jgi:hypothetical protein
VPWKVPGEEFEPEIGADGVNEDKVPVKHEN